MSPFSPEIMEDYIRQELAELERRPNDPRTKQELIESFRHYGRAFRPKMDWAPVK